VHQLISAKTEEKVVNLHYICVSCRRQFIDSYEKQGYSEEIKHECLEMYLNGLGFRAIERVKKVHHTTIITWVKKIGNELPNSSDRDEIPEVTQVDELQTFVGKKKQNLAMDSSK
jgi:transposase-like protein